MVRNMVKLTPRPFTSDSESALSDDTGNLWEAPGRELRRSSRVDLVGVIPEDVLVKLHGKSDNHPT